MNDIQNLKDRRDQLRSEAEQLHAEMLLLEAVLESEDPIEPDRKRELRDKYNELKRNFQSRDINADLLDRKISRRENLANCDSLMVGYFEAMDNWKADEQELNEKRQSLSTRLAQIKQQAVEDMAKARQAESDAATAYAQAVAWGDTEGEETANADAQKAAKNLTAAAEHNRRQTLMMTALEQELVTVDKYIAEAQEKHKGIERTALWLSQTVLEEQWNEAAKALFEVGGKLWANYNLLGLDHVALMKLAVPEQGETYGLWTWHELIDRSRQYSARDLVQLNSLPIPQPPEDQSNPEQRKDEHNEQATTEQRELV
ncbi:chromosome segregation protein SMC [Pseudomonas sp. ADAK2]|uniref:chromosome segregation protein SMC n=1 Tax=unclassified Pseudomonas TaxID=196821 RepID=UPI00146470B1|nr:MULTISPECIES: chromosome segregation protein SMC [unclassified Pseudomonas]QJI43042.1 chromosome segregation protein SMC [Pseudomonas sp. ADAK7]QJI49345.1 chromosome segregation protein SMC [Pseudomonas sp. ADAK2]